ncbi:hypothetical protein [Phaffia rhodozyma]|uniref:Uncharacterized protein n=1 Tax=Phaffia rhodozyma TaxID=264483 RepID=A0A0F7SG11_PHARH|nr:hypothetical protein [Phaffia rhodozyma]
MEGVQAQAHSEKRQSRRRETPAENTQCVPPNSNSDGLDPILILTEHLYGLVDVTPGRPQDPARDERHDTGSYEDDSRRQICGKGQGGKKMRSDVI